MLPGEAYRSDATAWAVVALAATRPGGHDRGAVESGRSRLAGSQLEDGRPIMGNPRNAGVLLMGRNLLSVDATDARVIGIDPRK